MNGFDRRTVLGAAAGVAGIAGGVLGGPAAGAVAATGAGTAQYPPLGPATVPPSDPRYQDLVRRGHPRYVASPDYVVVVGSTAQVVAAVQEAVRTGRRLAVRSGGHCLENLVDNPEVRTIIDMSGMTDVSYDPAMNAFAIEAGALLEEAYRRLFLGWGVTVPAGWCPKVGAGGHISVGGYGVLSRALGLVVDHLYAVEVVVVGADGRARTVVATRAADDPNRALWWAHTGGGGGNFGVVTRYWMRSPGATGTDPAALLPKAPAEMLDFTAQWPWPGLDETKFRRLADNLAAWTAAHSSPGDPATRLYAELIFNRVETGAHSLVGQVSGPGADGQLDAFLAALSAGVGPAQNLVRRTRPYLMTALDGPDASKGFRGKVKSAYLRSGFTAEQLGTVYRHLTTPYDASLLIGSVGLATYGGQINAVAPAETATSTRDAIFKLTYIGAWLDPAKDAAHDAWVRRFYADIYATTGGVPDPRDGAYIGYADKDLADPAINTSGVPWSTLYYKGNYPALQQVKRRYDPLNVFRHALSVTAE
jgi:FAD/FMN-containing dehydrogenase